MSILRLILTLAVALVPAVASAQLMPEMPRQEPKHVSANGTEVFRWLLHRAELKPYSES